MKKVFNTFCDTNFEGFNTPFFNEPQNHQENKNQ